MPKGTAEGPVLGVWGWTCVRRTRRRPREAWQAHLEGDHGTAEAEAKAEAVAVLAGKGGSGRSWWRVRNSKVGSVEPEPQRRRASGVEVRVHVKGEASTVGPPFFTVKKVCALRKFQVN